jgi:hypothetical protein
MTQLIYELETERAETNKQERERPLPPGLAFVPCMGCSAPVDLASLADLDRPQLCDRHTPAPWVTFRA